MWKVSSNRINGQTVYQVFRKIDEYGIDHSGNREYHKGFYDTKEQAQTVADKLNGGNGND